MPTRSFMKHILILWHRASGNFSGFLQKQSSCRGAVPAVVPPSRLNEIPRQFAFRNLVSAVSEIVEPRLLACLRAHIATIMPNLKRLRSVSAL